MAKALYDATNAEFGVVTGALDTDRQRMCEVFASAVVSHIAGFADVRIKSTDAGLQRDPVATNDLTDAPGADVVLVGAVE